MFRLTRRLAGAAVAAALAAFGTMSGTAAAQPTNLTATPGTPATVALPAARTPDAVLLDLYVRAYTPPRRGSVEAIVSLGPTGSEMEIARFAVFPSDPFFATSPRELRAYRFDASAALTAFQGRALMVQVRLVPIDESISPEGAKLTLGRVEVNPRPAN
jgi:hypothetical protein